ncbi:hypothetical protein NM688_g7533 [Phlebia brevispora]|uniref:Uncharacterized protein n=1 Tax=Phlebia brevispora TaxID=194682 RepID=A0ACC1S467_9APHY|nr:hypothetical protein NM688_g7533 [Phlebia brevispora]
MSSQDVAHPFTWSDADVVLRSSDSMDFRVHKLILSLASPVFATMFSIPQPITSRADTDLVGHELPSVDMSEDAETLEAVLRECYPSLGSKTYKNLASVKKVLAVAEKYEITGLMDKMEPILLQSRFLDVEPLRVYAIAHRYRLLNAIKAAAKSSLLQPSVEDRCPREFDDMSATAYHQLLVYRQRCTRVLDDLLKNWGDIWAREWRGGAPAAAWQLCQGESCRRFNPLSMPRLQQYGAASPWFLDHLERAKEAFRARVDGSTLQSLSLIQPTLDALRALSCSCCTSGPSNLVLFTQRLTAVVDKKLEGCMPNNSEQNLLDTQDSLAGLDIFDATPVVPPVESNPWQDAQDYALQAPLSPKTTPIDVQDLTSLDPVAVKGLAAEEDQEPHEATDTSQEILQEFDPLASHEERAAKEARESSESHSQPAFPPSEETQSVTEEQPQLEPPHDHAVDDATEQPPPAAPSSLSSFPSLAALARTFALPLTSRPRPRSLDTAAAVPSPATISSFASQQEMSRSAPSSAPESGRSTPTRGGKSSDTETPSFDFQKFLDQMKTRSAEPVAKYLRSFLSNFAKRTFTVNDQVKLINDFLNFISARMRETDIWRNATDAEFENAMEGMEKLVMNRLYDFTFTPQVARMVPPRPVTADDLERDRVLSQRIVLFKWIEPKHLDIPEENGSEGFMMFAQQGLIRHLRREEGADNFIPVLIYVVLKANPDHLLSNVEFINRFRNPNKLQSEAGYYLSSLMGAVSFIETMDHTSLSNITQEEFERRRSDTILAEYGRSNSRARYTHNGVTYIIVNTTTIITYWGRICPTTCTASAHTEPQRGCSTSTAEDWRHYL